MPSARFYKIRDRKTGKFSAGGMIPKWTARGKTWEAGPLKAHLRMVDSGPRGGRRPSNPYYSDAEVVSYEVQAAEVAVAPVAEFLEARP